MHFREKLEASEVTSGNKAPRRPQGPWLFAYPILFHTTALAKPEGPGPRVHPGPLQPGSAFAPTPVQAALLPSKPGGSMAKPP